MPGVFSSGNASAWLSKYSNRNMRWEKAHSRVIQQQHNGIQLLPGSVIGTQRHYEVVQAVSCCLSRNDNQLVLETIRLGIFKTIVPTTLNQTQLNKW